MDKQENPEKYNISPKTQIGHVHLTVNNIQKSLKFYQDILGFEIQQHLGGAVFLSAGGYHHHIGLNIWGSEYARQPEEGQIGLYHFAILYPNRKELAKALKNIIEHNYPLSGTADHGVSEALYLKDPDGNGIELYYDKPKSEWPLDKDGKLKMFTNHLDMDALLLEADL
ncbi:MAG: VOC family protein [archaeon]